VPAGTAQSLGGRPVVALSDVDVLVISGPPTWSVPVIDA
jgi:hypothetical protein